MRNLRYAIVSEHEDDDKYHYLPDGGNLTMCGREPQVVTSEVPEDRMICEACDTTEFSSKIDSLDDEALSMEGWGLVRLNRSRQNHLLLVSKAVERGLPICRGTKTYGPHAAIPLVRRGEQSSPCPLCGDVKLG